MAYPWIFSEGFEAGSAGGFDSEADDDSKLDFRQFPLSYSEHGILPYRGAYAMHIDLSGGTNDAYLQEGAIDIAEGATRYLSFYLNVPSALTMANTDLFTIFSFQSSGPADDRMIFLNDN